MEKLLDVNAFNVKRIGIYAGSILLLIILCVLNWGINDAGHRTVIQYPWGTINVKFEPGLYVTWFGKEDVYQDVITFDFDKNDATGEVSLNQTGIAVRYQDGGTGTIFGKARFSLPADETTMVTLHKAFRSNQAVTYKLIKTVTEEAQNLTAGLMSSEEAYAEKRGTFTEWARMQISNGKFVTELKQIDTKEVGTEKTVTKNIPVISYGKDGLMKQQTSDFKKYGITVDGFQITDWGFEPKTLEQIAAKRAATMGIITAKAEADRAKQDTITGEEKGKVAVMNAKYAREVVKVEAIVTAEQEKEVAVIGAKQKVDVAEQAKLEAEQKKLAAVAYKAEQILRGEADGAYKQKVMEADGALTQKLAALVQIQTAYAENFGKQKWVPEIQFGVGANAGGSNVTDLISMLNAKTAKDLSLDFSLPSTVKQQ
jgi:hypothetical protein